MRTFPAAQLFLSAIVIASACFLAFAPASGADPENTKVSEKPGDNTAAQAAHSSADKSDADGFVPLFDGKSLDGWVVTNCKAGVEDGNMVVLEGNGLVRTDKAYGDFVLELEWKNRQAENYDAGVFFRAEPPRRGPWPGRYQINLLQGQEGTLVYHAKGKAAGLARGGDWNRLRLTATGTTAELEINGKPAWKVDDIKSPTGIIGIQVEVPKGGQFEFRNIRVKPLTPPTPVPSTQPAAQTTGDAGK